MVIDTSAVVAILQSEPVSPQLIEVLEATADRRMSTASLVEASIVMLNRYGEHGEREVDLFVHRLGVDVTPVTLDHAEIARSATGASGKVAILPVSTSATAYPMRSRSPSASHFSS